MEKTVLETRRADLETVAGNPVMLAIVARDVASAAVARYSPALRVRQAYGSDGGLGARWLSGSPEHETNDCSVRALANVSELTYEAAHALIAERCGRVARKGPDGLKYAALLDTLAPRVADARGLTLAAFVRTHRRGVYLVWITGHALALIDGRVIDSHVSGARTRVYGAWKFAD